MSPRIALAALATLLLAPACRTLAPPQPEAIGLWDDAAGAVADPALAALCADAWEQQLVEDPFEATRRGDPRYHARVPDLSARGRDAALEAWRALADRAAEVDPAGLSASDAITHAMVSAQIGWRVRRLELDAGAWNVDSRRGPHVQLLSISADHPVERVRERAALVERYERVPRWLEDWRVGLRLAALEDRVASRTQVEKVIGQLDDLLATDPFDSPLVAPVLGGGRWVVLPAGGSVSTLAREELGDGRAQTVLRQVNHHLQTVETGAPGFVARDTRVLIPAEDDPLGPVERGQLLADVLAALEDDVYPALTRTRRFLARDLLPQTRPDDRPGLAHVPGGDAVYRAAIERHTTLDLDPAEIHAFGLQEVARIRAEMAEVGGRVFGTDDVAEIQRRLREDPAMHFSSRDEVEGYAREAVARAYGRLPEFFGRLPLADCEVVPVPAHEERDTTIAYYRGPSAEADRPGRYFVNTYAPETRPRYEAAVLAYHEAVPGHHLQIAIAQELEGLPLVRKHGGSTAFVEGWALYTERLCDEMGLYDTDVDRLGVLSFDAWRACRLVVDTGLHHFGWSRQEAIDYLFANTLLASNNVANEVDRYISTPGQALAYKLGQTEIIELRDLARARLGAAFSYPDFHDVVLEEGAVTLPILRERVLAWVERGGGPAGAR